MRVDIASWEPEGRYRRLSDENQKGAIAVQS